MPSVEADGAVGVDGRGVARVVDVVVVPRAQRQPVGVGATVLGPGLGVVQVAQARWPVAVAGGTASMSDAGGQTLGLVVEPAGATEVEDLGVAAEDGREDAGLAQQAPGRSR